MSTKFKSTELIHDIAFSIKSKRIAMGYTIEKISELTTINCGQISRFESGSFKTASKNLQIICNFLQIDMFAPQKEASIGSRLELFANQSPKHRKIAEEWLRVLESLDSVLNFR